MTMNGTTMNVMRTSWKLPSALLGLYRSIQHNARPALSSAELTGRPYELIFAHKLAGRGRDVERGVFNTALWPSFQTTA